VTSPGILSERSKKSATLPTPTKIWGIGILPRLDNTAPNFSGSGEIRVQLIAITRANRALQGK
jgi:hypothetical protein